MAKSSFMAVIYARKVESGAWKLEDVPALWRDEVKAILKKNASKKMK